VGPPEGVEVKVVQDDVGELGESKLQGDGEEGDNVGAHWWGHSCSGSSHPKCHATAKGKRSPKLHPSRGATCSIKGDNPSRWHLASSHPGGHRQRLGRWYLGAGALEALHHLRDKGLHGQELLVFDAA